MQEIFFMNKRERITIFFLAFFIVIAAFGKMILEDIKEHQTIFERYDFDKKLNINNATELELIRLPGVGRVTASRIISFRELNGSIDDAEDLSKVKGLGEKKVKKIEEYITYN
ncbi:MAG: helix-hairpin-helix domain-containing protein [Candidatus Omnitrophica bacterium]|nr:helix-hairpin-helix domain-containing protein [Candidatus Omnitrophota bacterium]